MKTKVFGKNVKGRWVVLLALFACVFLWLFPPANVTKASAATESATVHEYVVNAHVESDGRIYIEERLDMTINVTPRGNTFYRSLPMEGDRFFNIQAKCEGNDEFSVSVAENPDVDGFMDINCYGGVRAGNRWTYEFSYVMLISGISGDGTIVDFVGAGWPFSLHNVTVNVEFPATLKSYKIYSSAYGTSDRGDVVVLKETETSLSLYAENLSVYYDDVYESRVALPITVEFTLEKGAFSGYGIARIFSDGLWLAIVVGVLLLGLATLIFFKCRKVREVVPIVNIKPPQGMDPLRMGKFIDGTVDSEDITSMVYYFASQGYLTISLVGDEPVLRRTGKVMPDNAPAYQKTLLGGLFKGTNEVGVSDLANQFYLSADKAQTQLSVKDIPAYENKSTVAAFGCALLSAAIFCLVPLLMGLLYVGHGYLYWPGVFMSIPVAVSAAIMALVDRRKYKWKKGACRAWTVLAIVVFVIGALVYTFAVATHLMTESEKIVVSLCAAGALFLSSKVWSHSERYVETLGQVLGFKEFIEVTEDEDRIKFMLAENPELFYDVLPYAQVLGVTNEWEKKFEGILVSPPSWYTGSTHMTMFDYYVFSSCMRSASFSMMTRPKSSSSSTVGGSGGGGSFGGFSGGGHGGGGGGFR